MKLEFTPRTIIDALFTEGALFGFLYYVQILLKVEGDLWLSTAILWVLLNAIYAFSPFSKTS